MGGDTFKLKDIPTLSDYIVKKLKDFILKKFVDPSCHRYGNVYKSCTSVRAKWKISDNYLFIMIIRTSVFLTSSINDFLVSG